MSNEPDQVNSGALFTTILLVAFSTLGVALVVTALVRTTTAEIMVGKDASQENAFRQLKADQVASLTKAPGWTDRATGLVSVPIDRAMEMVATEVRKNPYALTPKDPEAEDEEESEEDETDASEDAAAAEGGTEEEADDGDAAQANDAPTEGSPEVGTTTTQNAPPDDAASTPDDAAPQKQPAPKKQPAPPKTEAPAPNPTP